jgi:hypothetical protein
MNAYWSAIQKRVCRKCIDGDGTGNCRLPADETCPLKLHLAEIVTTVANAKANSYSAYVNSLRRNVCILCDWQSPEGTCQRRADLECALDRYHPLVVDIIEYVREQMGTEPLVQSSSFY